eukprot:scaffold74852_cov57-Phaeocystis_antarctica.AAC.2
MAGFAMTRDPSGQPSPSPPPPSPSPPPPATCNPCGPGTEVNAASGACKIVCASTSSAGTSHLTTCQEAVVSQQCRIILPPSAPLTVPQSPPSPPLAPFADEPCTENTQDDRCKVTLKIKARLLH